MLWYTEPIQPYYRINEKNYMRFFFRKLIKFIIKATAILFAILISSFLIFAFFGIEPLYEYLGTELKEPQTFDTNGGLVVTNFIGSIKIIESDKSDKITIKADGPEDYLGNLKVDGVYKSGAFVYIRHTNPESPVLKEMKNINSALITVQIPPKAILQLGITAGKVEIAERTGDVEVNINGSASVNIKNLDGALKGNITGNGNIDVAYLKGNLDTSIRGEGTVKIFSGTSPCFKARIVGPGVITHLGIVKDADLEIQGPGKITIHKFVGKLSENVLGPGSIKIDS